MHTSSSRDAGVTKQNNHFIRRRIKNIIITVVYRSIEKKVCLFCVFVGKFLATYMKEYFIVHVYSEYVFSHTMSIIQHYNNNSKKNE